MKNAVEIKNLVKTYANGTQALKGIDLTIHQGDFFALLGANGAGKTTIIGILTDLVNKSSGSVKVFGKDIDRHLTEAKLNIGVVPQEFNFNIFEKVQDIVVTQGGYFGVGYKEALERSGQLLKALGLWEKRNKTSNSLSGGMKRRLMIARALIHKPGFLILDEPTAGVDVELRRTMWDYLKELNQKGTTVLLTTHYLEEVEQLCNRMAMIKDGVIIKEGSVKSILKNMDSKQFVITVGQTCDLSFLSDFKVMVVDEITFEVELNEGQSLADVMIKLKENKISVDDIRPKTNRIEEFFIQHLKK